MKQIRNRSSSLRIQENRKEEKRLRKKKNKKTVADTGYKKVDRKEKKKKEKQEEKRRQKKLSVQQSIAYKEMGRDGMYREKRILSASASMTSTTSWLRTKIKMQSLKTGVISSITLMPVSIFS
jgi:hypothetical protein